MSPEQIEASLRGPCPQKACANGVVESPTIYDHTHMVVCFTCFGTACGLDKMKEFAGKELWQRGFAGAWNTLNQLFKQGTKPPYELSFVLEVCSKHLKK